MVCASVTPLHTRTCVVIFHAGRRALFYGKKNGVCAGFAPSQTDFHRYFSLWEDVRHFPARGPSPSMDRGITRCPRVCAWIPRLLIRLRVVPGGCAWNFLSHGSLRADFLSGSRAALSMRGRVSKFRSHRRRHVERRLSLSTCGEFFTAEQAVRQIVWHTRSPVEKEKSFWS
ncbi:hypothetical protein NDU88_009692 [Pleurodeles waltl]|uniref:Uncharacterized protein n=1 Tax=Pleurodeles waltl TaxID=8319 RepID=A0AAV7PTJ4_PLEWA|nr:hypothetical protein NDU88_009692 [Pleurodeles waltl]